MKKMAKATYLLCIILFFVALLTSALLLAYPERFYPLASETTISETENISIVNLEVSQKGYLPEGMVGMFSRYYLVLSNDMLIYISSDEYKDYEEGKYYDFELLERTVTTHQLRVMDEDK